MDVTRPSRVPDPYSLSPAPHEGRRSACDAVVIISVDPLYEVFKHAYEGGVMMAYVMGVSVGGCSIVLPFGLRPVLGSQFCSRHCWWPHSWL